jgi:hypothetical protein
VRGQQAHGEPVAVFPQDGERLPADRARAAQNRYASSRHDAIMQ